MVLSDKTIKELLNSKELVIDPLGSDAIQPASVDCTLGDNFLVIEANQMDILTLDSEIKYQEITSDLITIPAHSFILATTEQYIKLPNNLTAFVEGRSSIGRMGLFIQNAGWVDPGFEGKITLELYNANSLPIKLKSKSQLVFCEMSTIAENPYRGKYQGQNKTVGSRISNDIEVLGK